MNQIDTHTTAYKLVYKGGYTFGREERIFQWLPGKCIQLPQNLLTEEMPGYNEGFQFYISPEVAMLASPFVNDINYHYARCIKIEPILEASEAKDFNGWKTNGIVRWINAPLRVVEEISLPILTDDEYIAWIICYNSPRAATREKAIRWFRDNKDVESILPLTAWETEWEKKTFTGRLFVNKRSATKTERAVWADAKIAEARLMPALQRARSILKGEYPVEQFDNYLEIDGKEEEQTNV